MKFFNYLLLFFLGIFIVSCGGNPGEKSSNYSLVFSSDKNEFQLGDSFKASAKSKSGAEIDSVVFFLNGKRLTGTKENSLNHTFQDEKLGKWDLTAAVYSEGEKEEVRKELIIYNNERPQLYTYKIIASYPHSAEAYTQGLEFYRDTLYESTGQYGESTLRKLNYKTGEVLKSVPLEDSYFAEGLSILNNKIYQLTWKEDVGIIYDVDSFEKIGSFSYYESEQGWGLTNDGEKFYKSDGTEKIWILNGETLAEEGFIQTVTNNSISTQLNELEWVEGKIYANTYQRDGVAIINPENGAIEGVIDFQGLRENLGNEADLDPVNDVLNGIAYNPNTKRLYVTGKDWDKLFEIEIIEK